MENRYNSKVVTSPHPTKDSTISNSSLLVALNEEMFRRLAPAVSVLVALMVVGAVGNILICYIFIRKLRTSSQNLLLLSLGIFDLVSSCVGVPSEIYDISQYFLYESGQLCRAMRFLTTFPSLASILVLLVIATDRYRRICKPLRAQIGLNHVRIAIIIIVIVALSFSVPALYIYGHRSFPTPVADLYGHDCSVDDAFKDSPYPLVYEGLFLVAFCVFAVVLVCIYIRIWLETRRHIKYLKTHATFGTGMMGETSTTTSSGNYEDSSLENVMDGSSRSGSRKSWRKSQNKKRESRRSRRRFKSVSKREAKLAMLPEVHPTVSFVIGGKSPDTNKEQATPAPFKYTHQDSNGAEVKDNYDAYITSGDLPKCRVFEDATEAARTLLSSLPSESLDVSEPRILQDSIKTSRTLLDSFLVGGPGTSDLGVTDSSRTLLRSNSLTSPDIADVASGSHIYSYKSVPQDDSEEASALLNVDKCKHSSVKEGKSMSTTSQENVKSNPSHSNKSKSQQGQSKDNFASPSADLDLDPGGWSREPSPELNKTKSQNPIDVPHINITHNSSHIYYSPAGTACQPHPSDGSTQVVRAEEINNSQRNQNGVENSSSFPSVCENYLTNKLEYYDTKCKNTPCSDVNKGTPTTDSKHGSQRLQFEPKENTALVSGSGKIPEKNISQSKRTSFFAQSDTRLETADIKTDQSQPFTLTNQGRGSNYSKSSQSMNSTKRARKALRATRTTIIAFAITTGFIISYLPHLVLILLRTLKTDFEHNLDDVSLNFYNVFLRSYFVNNVVNVFVYGTINLQFRTEIVGLLGTFKCARG